MAKTVKGLLDHCKDAVKKEVKYIYGAKWKVLNYAQIKALQNEYGTDMVWVSDLNKAGHLCCDCSGLISSYTGIVRGSTNYKDTCKASVSISELNKNWTKYIGWALWMQGHIGVVSDTKGYYYAMDGSARNMVHNPMSKQGWTKCIKLCDIDYTVATPTSTPQVTPVPKPVTIASKLTDIKFCIGGKNCTCKGEIVDGSTLVQARGFLTILGLAVGFNNDKKRVMAGGLTLDIKTIIENNTAYFYVRDCIDFLNKYGAANYHIGYNATSKTIAISK